MCLRNGDVVTHVNGFSLAEPDNSARVLASMRDGTHGSVDLQRGGVPMRLSYTIRP